MKTIAMPSLLSLRMTSKSCAVSWARQAGGRLVEDQDLALEIASARAIAAICWIATE